MSKIEIKDVVINGDDTQIGDKIGFSDEEWDEWHLDFSHGTIDFGNYSYRIDGYGTHEINEEQTKKLYEAMKKYYEDE